MALDFPAENMVYWSADEREPLEVSLDRVRKCDVFLLIVAHRYGSVPEGSSLSITEQEYNAARSSNVPVLAFFVDENLPWPPQFIEWEKRNQLAGFKKKIRSEVTVRTFTSPDNLSALISQALVSFKTRHGSAPVRGAFHRTATVRVDPAVNLEVSPDLSIQVGYAEDELPLLLQVRRSGNLMPLFDDLAKITSRPGFEAPQALLSTFRQSVEQHAMRAWASDGIQPVKMQDGSTQRLFILADPLCRLFQSAFELLLHSGKRAPSRKTATTTPAGIWRRKSFDEKSFDEGSTSAEMPLRLSTSQQMVKPLQSEGGSNRFLGIATKDGRVFSVGRPRDEFGGYLEGWLEWRPFLFESLPRHFPEAIFRVHGTSKPIRVLASHYQKALLDAALAVSAKDILPVSVYVEVLKNSVASMIVHAAEAVAQLHAAGAIHGDLKPTNILLSSEGITLIDDFQLRIGETAPGWTPGWSAPEQALGERVSTASDVYPFGRFIAELLQGNVTGEVRKFKTTSGGQRQEFDVFYNAFVRVPPESTTAPRDGVNAWKDLARRCLRFNPEERPSIQTFADELSVLVDTFPLAGNSFFHMQDNLVAARFVDGREGLARLLMIESTSDPSDSPSASGAYRRP